MRVNSFLAHEKERPHRQVENICGVLLHARPDLLSEVTAALEALPGVEIHMTGAEGKMVVTVEDAEGTWAGATMDQFNKIPGVLSVTLAYHHFDSELAGETVQ
ncbi:MAG: chaperone NapD [Rhodospirillaceae bacterium]|nr:chaperone NapD [Rhodospirillales bacterium]